MNVFEIVFGIVITTATGFFTTTLRRSWNMFKSLQSAQRALIKDRIVQAHRHFMDKGHIDGHSIDAINGMYREYDKLGGNGYVNRLMDDLHTLVIKY